MSHVEAQCADTVLMVRPVAFRGNPQTAPSNAFQRQAPEPDAAAAQVAAAGQFDALVEALKGAGVGVLVVEDTPEPDTPDAVFPNNWVSFHADGTAVLYPMLAENRRDERRADVLEALTRRWGYRIDRVIDLSGHEDSGQFLEGTGSLVLDRPHRVAYACTSPRTHLDAIGDFAQQLDYDVVAFNATGADGSPIYHTNVMMNVGESFAVVCLEAIDDAGQRAGVAAALEETGHEVLAITREQMGSFAGNMLELASRDGGRVVAMSQRALDSLDPTQRERLAARAQIVASPIDDIEDSAGGSVRCMLAEIHLPRRGRGTS